MTNWLVVPHAQIFVVGLHSQQQQQAATEFHEFQLESGPFLTSSIRGTEKPTMKPVRLCYLSLVDFFFFFFVFLAKEEEKEDEGRLDVLMYFDLFLFSFLFLKR